MKTFLIACTVLIAALLIPGRAAAHPLGNFTVNHFAGIEVAGDAVYVHYVLDLAEVPTFQDGELVTKPAFARRVARDLELIIDGRRATLAVVESRVERQPGAGGLSTIRFDAILRADGQGSTLTFRDTLYPDRIGWRELTVSARNGATIDASDAPSRSVSDELRSYPDDRLASPLDIRSANASFTLGDAAAPPPTLAASLEEPHRGEGFEALIEGGALTPLVVFLSLLVAAFWGAVHALTPGHGKAIVAGYLVGTKGRPRDAFLLGATVTVTHTIGVFALGLVTLALSQFIVPEQLYPWLAFVSGLLVVAVGFGVLRSRLRTGRWDDHDHDHGHGDGAGDHHHHHHGDGHHRPHHHHHGDGHHRPHHHHQDHPSSRGIVGVGIAAGILPCPSALVVLLSAIALHRIGFGFALIVAFSLGLAATITSIGLVAVLARRTFARASFDGRLVRALPAVSALAILCVGLGLTLRAIPAVLATITV